MVPHDGAVTSGVCGARGRPAVRTALTVGRLCTHTHGPSVASLAPSGFALGATMHITNKQTNLLELAVLKYRTVLRRGLRRRLPTCAHVCSRAGAAMVLRMDVLVSSRLPPRRPRLPTRRGRPAARGRSPRTLRHCDVAPPCIGAVRRRRGRREPACLTGPTQVGACNPPPPNPTFDDDDDDDLPPAPPRSTQWVGKSNPRVRTGGLSGQKMGTRNRVGKCRKAEGQVVHGCTHAAGLHACSNTPPSRSRIQQITTQCGGVGTAAAAGLEPTPPPARGRRRRRRLPTPCIPRSTSGAVPGTHGHNGGQPAAQRVHG